MHQPEDERFRLRSSLSLMSDPLWCGVIGNHSYKLLLDLYTGMDAFAHDQYYIPLSQNKKISS